MKDNEKEIVLRELVDIVETISIAVNEHLHEEDAVDIQNRLDELKKLLNMW